VVSVFALNFPDASIGQVVGLFPERSYKCGAEPLHPIVRLSREVSVVERDQVRAFVSAVAGFFGILVAVPIQGEQILIPPSQAPSLVCTRRKMGRRAACYDRVVDGAEMSAGSIAENLLRVEERIGAACLRAGRARSEITLIGVSKTHSAGAIREAYAAGLRHFGENRVQEWEGKRGEVGLLPGALWHLIGHLQSNKAVRAATIFDCVDSVDDFGLAERLRRARLDETRSARTAGTELRVLIEVRLAEEDTKNGVTVAELPGLAERILPLDGIALAGLMCIPPFLEDTELARPYFRALREARDLLAGRLRRELPVLSMGMSHDFAVAIE
jgi:pyridoxal phosphate enzyme (YggS family)